MHSASILISSFNRLPLFRRTLWSIANNKPSIPFEVVVVDDGSTDDILGELRTFSSQFPWKLIQFDANAFEEATGLKKFFNNPSVTNNIAFKAAAPESDIIFQQGNEVIAWDGVYDKMIADIPERPHWMVMSTTYDIPKQYVDLLDVYGQNLLPAYVQDCCQWPLQSEFYQSDVTNYLSAAPRSIWESLDGYDERYFGGISAEDSDFVRRARTLPGFTRVISRALSLHQSHKGMTRYYSPPPSIITQERWAEGVSKNHAVYNAWAGQTLNQQSWPWGSIGVGRTFTNTK